MVTPRKEFTKERKDKKNFLLAAAFGLGVVGMTLGISKISNYLEKSSKLNKTRQQYFQNIDSTYNSIIKESVDDTIFINQLNKYVPFSEKERIVKENNLEKSFE